MAKSVYVKNGRKLLSFALDNYYAFDDDEIENKIEESIIKYSGKNIENRNKKIRNYIWSFEKIRNKICNVAKQVYGDSFYERNY